MSSITSLSWLSENEKFKQLMKSMLLQEKLSDTDYSYMLSCAILFIKHYEKDKRRTTSFELGYFIILSYCNTTEDYAPLYDISTSFGFYPISKFIIDNSLYSSNTMQQFSLENKLNNFLHNGITETYEQRKNRVAILKQRSKESSYVAPTSFGKSSLFIELIATHRPKKTAVIVPTKSLLTQTYRNIDRQFPKEKIIFHDEMYNDDENFIAIFTQERALRLMKNHDVSFDMLIIDEAHNIFEYSSRSILLTRLIRRNRKRNLNSKTYYFSPLISDSNNLKFEQSQEIEENTIRFNVKEPRFFECKPDGDSFVYSRFLNEFYASKKYDNYLNYLRLNSKNKNFFYLKAPKKVELLASLVADSCGTENTAELESLSATISKNVHEDFYVVDLVKKGVIYLHGKLPDLVKEYMEFKFRTTKALKYIVANKVILEGVNLPIDNLFVMNSHGLSDKDLINLIGRVNRLNEVFDRNNGSLKKLSPSVHFVNSEFSGKNSNMRAKMEKLKSGTFKDDVQNPVLLSFELDRLKGKLEQTSSDKEKERLSQKIDIANKTLERENFLLRELYTDKHHMMALIMEANVDSSYYDQELLFDKVLEKSDAAKSSHTWDELDTLDKVYEVFINDLEKNISDRSFLRLSNVAARNFYRMFVRNIHSLSLREHINDMVRYFYSISTNSSGKRFFIGPSYGEVALDPTHSQKSYIDLSIKSHKELVNLALVKIKMESDFVSYKLNEYVALLLGFGLISESEYNLFIYGTSKKLNSVFTKLGFSGTLISKLENDKQLGNITVNELGHVSINGAFRDYVKLQDDLIQFEISKYINLN